MGLNTWEGTSGHSCCPELWGPAFPCWHLAVAVATAASPLSPCLCATEEQFILAQVALLEQVDALVPMLDSASIKGTLSGHSSTLGRAGRRRWGRGFPVPMPDLLPIIFYPVGTCHLTVVKIPE